MINRSVILWHGAAEKRDVLARLARLGLRFGPWARGVLLEALAIREAVEESK
jgi:hypothetical protein